MVMVAVPVPGPPQVPGAVGHTSSAPESWMVKVAVFSSARAPLAAMTAPTEDRSTVRTAMLTSRLPIEPPFLWPDASIRLLPPGTVAPAAGYGPARHGCRGLERLLATQRAAAAPGK